MGSGVMKGMDENKNVLPVTINSDGAIMQHRKGVELVASQLDEAVGDAYATIMDAVDVTAYKWLSVYVLNAAGGSGDAILQYQIKAMKADGSGVYTALNDTGGIAANAFNYNTGYLIGPGETIDGFFPSTISIIAKCDTGEDTTASVYLYGVKW